MLKASSTFVEKTYRPYNIKKPASSIISRIQVGRSSLVPDVLYDRLKQNNRVAH